MPPLADPAADRRFLALSGRTQGAPDIALAMLALVDAITAAGFALGLTLALTAQSPGLGLAGLLLAMAVRTVAAWASSRLAARHARRVKSRLREGALRAVLDRRRDAETSLGEAAGAVVEEIEALDGYFGRYRSARIAAADGPLAITAAVALASPIAAAILLATLAPFIAIMALAGGAAGTEASRQFEALARLSGLFVDRVRALPVILAFQAEARETARVGEAARDVSERTLGVLRIAFISTAALEFFAALSVALVAVYAGFSLLGLLPFRVPETLDFPRAFFALALAPEFYAPLRRMAAAYHEKQLGEAAASRLRPMLGAASPPPVTPLMLDAPPAIVMHGATLRFGGDQRIGPIDAVFPAGAVTALVGPTGSGKTSLLAAILGLVPLEGGEVEVGPWRLSDTGGFAAVAAWAGQSPAFLPGTLLDNLMAAAPGVTRQDAVAAAERVGLGPALSRREDGGDTRLDERGSGLSGGERRRLSIARALLKPSRLLLLDEPTADLDADAEAQIIALIRQAAGDRTIIVATHSEAFARAADHVVRLA